MSELTPEERATQEQANVEAQADLEPEAPPPPPPLFNASQRGINFADGSDAYANDKKLFLSFFHLASSREINFKAFITNFTQNFQTEWGREAVFGRNDPIMTFKSTGRRLAVSFQIPASTLTEARINLNRINNLAQFMYPAYERSDRANTIAKPSLMRIRFANLIGNMSRGESPHAKESGLLVAVSSLTIVPSFDDDGFFDPGTGKLFPKLITIDMDMTALHEHDLGWDDTPGGKDFGFSKHSLSQFPFGGNSAPTPPSAPPAFESGGVTLEGDAEIEDEEPEGVSDEQTAAAEALMLDQHLDTRLGTRT